MGEKENEKKISYFSHEGMIYEMTRIIRWLIIALVAVLAIGFIYAYVNNQNWLKYVDEIRKEQTYYAGERVQQQPDGGAD